MEDSLAEIFCSLLMAMNRDYRNPYFWRYDIQNNDTQYNDIQHYDSQQKGHDLDHSVASAIMLSGAINLMLC
jgi:hypothetical protein